MFHKLIRKKFISLHRLGVNLRRFSQESVQEDDVFVINGPTPKQPLPKMSLGKYMYDRLIGKSDIHPALVDASIDQGISYRELLCQSCSLAEALLKKGICKNHMISVCCENMPEYFIPVLASFYIGSIIAPVNPTYGAREIFHTLNLSKPRIMFTSKLVCPKFLAAKSNLPFLEKIVVLDTTEDISGAETLDHFIKVEELNTIPEKFQVADVNPDEQVALILYSSGTSGLPKGVMLTHTNVFVSLMHTQDPRYWMPNEGAILGLLPFYHVFGLLLTLSGLVLNNEVAIMKRFEEHFFLCTIQKYKIPSLTLAPPLVLFLSKHPIIAEYDLSHVKEVICGAAPLSKLLEEMLKTRLSIPSIRQGYGLTEAPLAIISIEVGDEKFGSCGKLMSYVRCKVRDTKTGKSLGPNQTGELCFKGSMIMKGYLNDEQANAEAFTSDGWLKTGDIGYYDEDQYFFIVDRMKEVIFYKGFQVAPAELEALLMTYPKIRDAGVIGVPDPEAGEIPLAFVVKYPHIDVTEDEIVIYVAKNISSAKKLRGGVIFVDAIPKTTTGKILRRVLKEMYKKIATGTE